MAEEGGGMPVSQLKIKTSIALDGSVLREKFALSRRLFERCEWHPSLNAVLKFD